MMDPLKPLADYPSRLHHIHLKDAHVFKEKLDRVGIMATPLQFHSPRIPGRGDLDWPSFFRALKASGYRGPVCIEVEDKDFEGSPEDIEKAVILARDHIRNSMTVA
jgi:sugar phosphate isomerase/epimerase